jgi:hypothetical protein
MNVLLLGHTEDGPTAMIIDVPMTFDVITYAYSRAQLRFLERVAPFTGDALPRVTRTFRKRDELVYEEVSR